MFLANIYSSISDLIYMYTHYSEYIYFDLYNISFAWRPLWCYMSWNIAAALYINIRALLQRYFIRSTLKFYHNYMWFILFGREKILLSFLFVYKGVSNFIVVFFSLTLAGIPEWHWIINALSQTNIVVKSVSY